METFKRFESQLYDINDRPFEDIAIPLFHFQATHNPVYKAYIEHLGVDIQSVTTLEKIPFLPISMFKNHRIQTGEWIPSAEFTSSGTTGTTPSRHLIRDLTFYHDHSKRCFETFFGDLRNYNILALLPSYLERKDSSLISMINHFIKETSSEHSGFYLYDYDRLLSDIGKLKGDKRKTLVWGVSFALLDLAERYQPDLSHCLVFETGGMKGRRKELTRAELHETLTGTFRVREVFSEYGMTELLSQCYSQGGNWFFCPPYVKILVREVGDPFNLGIEGVGGLNVIDLANFHSVSFVETEDLGAKRKDGSFEVVGRMDNSEVRGCNLLVG